MIKRITSVIALTLCMSMSIMAAEQEVIFKFSNTNDLGLPSTDMSAANINGPEVAAIKDDIKIVKNNVTVTNQKNHTRYWNRILDEALSIYPGNSITISVPENVEISKIAFVVIRDRGSLNTPDTPDTLLPCDDDNGINYTWNGQKQSVTFVSATWSTATRLKKMTVTVKDKAGSAVEDIHAENTTAPTTVYNLQGVKLGSAEVLSTLPSGIYIVGGKKIVK